MSSVRISVALIAVIGCVLFVNLRAPPPVAQLAETGKTGKGEIRVTYEPAGGGGGGGSSPHSWQFDQ